MNKLHPPNWLTGNWKGSPHGARMRVDEDGVAIRLAETSNIKHPAGGGQSFEVATPIHVNPTQVSTDSVDGQTYRLQAIDGISYEATLQQDGSVLVVVDGFEMNFPSSGREIR